MRSKSHQGALKIIVTMLVSRTKNSLLMSLTSGLNHLWFRSVMLRLTQPLGVGALQSFTLLYFFSLLWFQIALAHSGKTSIEHGSGDPQCPSVFPLLLTWINIVCPCPAGYTADDSSLSSWSRQMQHCSLQPGHSSC